MRAGLWIFLLFLCAAPAPPAAAEEGTPIKAIYSADGLIPLQGECAPEHIDLGTGTAACTGGSQSMINLEYANNARLCVYVDNYSPQQKDFFVPLRSFEEWVGFRNKVAAGQLPGVSLAYGCAHTGREDHCHQKQNLPDGRNGEVVEFDAGNGQKITYRCNAPDSCGVWKKDGDASSECRQDGVCGTAATRAFHDPPAVNLCSQGAAAEVTLSSDPKFGSAYNWTCKGTGGGQDAPCTARHAGELACGPASGGGFAGLNAHNSQLCPYGVQVSDFIWTGSGWTWFCWAGFGPALAYSPCSAAYQNLTGGN